MAAEDWPREMMLHRVTARGLVRALGRMPHANTTEERLLALLSATPGRIWSCEAITRALWGMRGSPRTSNLVRVSVKGLRKRGFLIVTERGRGYRLQKEPKC